MQEWEANCSLYNCAIESVPSNCVCTCECVCVCVWMCMCGRGRLTGEKTGETQFVLFSKLVAIYVFWLLGSRKVFNMQLKWLKFC